MWNARSGLEDHARLLWIIRLQTLPKRCMSVTSGMEILLFVSKSEEACWHLVWFRSTIIGESIRRVLEFCGHEVHGYILSCLDGL